MDRLVRFYRRLSTTARSVIVFVLAVSVALATMHALTFSATAITKKTGEEDPGIVLNQDPENEDFDNVSEGTGTDNPEEKPSEPAETPAAPEVQEGEPSPEPSAMPEEPGTEPEVTAAPEETGAPEETEAPEEVIIAEEEQSGAELLSEEPEEESDPTADIETAADWEKLFRDIEFTGVWADDLLAVAESQIGYRESKANFIRDEENIKRGYTRYGAWYGDAYAKWDSLFVLFSMYYTGITIDQFPFKADCEDWIEALKEKELFFEADDYVPNKGDLVFADTDEDGEADYVAIVKAVETKEGESDKLVVIEGDSGDEVKESRHEFNNPLILGYAQLPENPELAEEEEPEAEPVYASFEGKANNVEVTVLYEEGAFPEGTTMKVKPVWRQSVLGAINDTVTDKEVVKVQAVDITFFNATGEEIEPDKPIRVTMKSTAVPVAAVEAPVVVHVDDELNTEVVATEQVENEEPHETVAFESDSFSIYAIVYTVDFEYEKEGRMYRFSLDGGASISLADLCAVLGMNGETETPDAFAARVTDASFSNPSLVKVYRSEYGWMLESLKPFDTEETLTLTMDDGEVIVVRVTDDQSTGVWDLADENNTQFLHVSADSSITETEQERNAAFRLTFSYSLKEDVVRAIDAYEGYPVLEYDLASTIANSPIDIKNNTNGVISIGTRKLGNYTVVDGKVRLTFTDPSYFDGRTSFTGFFNLTAETDETRLGDEDKWEYHFPGTGDTVTIHYKDEIESAGKTYNLQKNPDGSYTLKYTANINVHNDLDSLTFNDTLGGLQTLDPNSVKINGTSVTVSQSGQNFSFDVAAALHTTGVAKGNYAVTYETTVTEEQLRQMSENKTTETNTASWKVNGKKDVPGGHTEVEFEKPHEPVPVVKTISSTTNLPGDIVTYTVTYGSETTELSGFHFSDYMTDVVIPQGQVTVTANGTTQQIDFAGGATDTNYSKGMTTLYDYTFPEGTPGKGPVTVTYSVKLIDAETAKNSGIYDATDVTNTAQEHKYNTTDTKKTTVTYEKEPHYEVTKTETSNKTEDGKWAPGTEIHYTLTIGDIETEMGGVHIRDVMTDLQTLQGDVMIKVGNGQQMKLTDYVADAIKWADDGQYNTNDVTLFDFNMPANAGKGPVVITYTTKVIEQSQATSANIFGDQKIRNTGSGGNQSDGTEGIGEFEKINITKTVTQNGASVNGKTVEMDSTVHYTLTYGNAGVNMAGAYIEDWMTDLQKLVGDITITRKDGSSFVMPAGTGQWSADGNNWGFWDDGKYGTDQIMLFRYRLPDDIGEGPIKVEYDVQLITEDEAKESGVTGTKSAFNKFIEPQTEIKIDFPAEVTHNPKVTKNPGPVSAKDDIVYWDIILEKDVNSAYPLTNVYVREFADQDGIFIRNPDTAVYHEIIRSYEGFDLRNAVVTTDDGTELTLGIDYTIDKTKGQFNFPVLNERVHIRLPYHSPYHISNGFYMHNVVETNNYQRDDAEITYTNPNAEVIKNGSYSESERLFAWEVHLNPSKKPFTDSDQLAVWFTDQIPAGLTLVNYNDHSDTSNPSIFVEYHGNVVSGDGASKSIGVTPDSSNKIGPVDVAAHNAYGNQNAGLNNQYIIVKYYTLLSNEEWDRITSSLSGSETFENHVEVTAGDDEKFDATDKVTVTSDEYISKFDTTQEDEHGVVVDADRNNTKEISYKVDINPHGHKLNVDPEDPTKSFPLQLTDFIATNMDLHTESVKVYKAHMGDDGHLVAESEECPGLSISYNDDSRQLAIRNIPDATPLVLVYSCYARAQGTDTFTNTATLIGGGSHSSSVTDEHNIQTNDAGVKVDGIDMNMFKIDENDISRKLQGAQFQLYECELEIGELTNPETYNQAWWDNLLAMADRRTAGTSTQEENDYIDAHFKIVNYKQVGDPAVTGESGFTQWTGLNEHKLYAWKEVRFPDNYTGNDDYHYFVGYQHINVNSDQIPQPLLPDNEQLNRKHAAWALDDACQFANGIRVASMANLTTWTATNVEAEYTSISATKEWENDWDDLYETRPTNGIILHLWQKNADGTTAQVQIEGIANPVPINADDNGNWPTYTWNKLPAKDTDGNKIKYFVVEEPVDDYSTTYSDEQLGIERGEITVINRLIPKSTDIHIEKVFEGVPDDEKPESIKATLYVFRTDHEGVKHCPEEMPDYSVELSANNNWKWTFEKLPTRDADGNVLSYTVVEDTKALERLGYRFVVTYSDNGKGVIETTAENPLKITNAKEAEIDIDIKKVDNANNPIAGAKFELYKKNKSGEFVKVTKAEESEFDWLDSDDTFTVGIDGLTLTGLKDGTYRIKEVEPPEGYIIVDSEPITFTVVDGKVDEDSVDVATGVGYKPAEGPSRDTFTVPNESGVPLPMTGGSGTDLIYLTGILLIGLCGVLLLRRKFRRI